jgi:phage gp29-like protein
LYELNVINRPGEGTLLIPMLPDRRTYAVDNQVLHRYDDKGSHVNAIPLPELEDTILVDHVSWMPVGAVMRGVAPVEILRQDMVLENANFLRKLKGILQVINKGSSQDNVTAARAAAATAIQNNYLITDDMVEFKLNEITAGGNGAFKDFIDWANKEMAIAFLGQASTSELPDHGGSRAAVGVLAKLSQDIFYHDISRVTDLVNRLLEIDFKYNVSSSGGIPPWKFSVSIPEESDIEANANALETLKRASIPVRKTEAYSLLGLSVPGDEDELL